MGFSAWPYVLLLSVKALFVKKRCSCDLEAELTGGTPGAGVATQSLQGWSEAAIAG